MDTKKETFKKNIIFKLKEIEILNFKLKIKEFKKIFGIEASIFQSKKALNDFLEILISLLEDNNNKTLKIEENDFFKTNSHEEIFYLLNFEKNFDEELGITKFHYVDKDLAKKWKKNMMKKYHPDIINKHNFNSQNINLLSQNINKIYKRLVGEAK